MFVSGPLRRRCKAVMPSLNKARIVSEQVGFRPARAKVRVEKEIQNGTIKVTMFAHSLISQNLIMSDFLWVRLSTITVTVARA